MGTKTETKEITELKRKLANAGLKLNTLLKGKIRSQKVWENIHSLLRCEYEFSGGGGIVPFKGRVGSVDVVIHTQRDKDRIYHYYIQIELTSRTES